MRKKSGKFSTTLALTSFNIFCNVCWLHKSMYIRLHNTAEVFSA